MFVIYFSMHRFSRVLRIQVRLQVWIDPVLSVKSDSLPPGKDWDKSLPRPHGLLLATFLVPLAFLL